MGGPGPLPRERVCIAEEEVYKAAAHGRARPAGSRAGGHGPQSTSTQGPGAPHAPPHAASATGAGRGTQWLNGWAERRLFLREQSAV